MKNTSAPLRPVDLLKLLAVAGVYALTSWLVQTSFSPKGEASIFFLPSGVAMAALLLGGKRYFWAVFVGALLGNLFFTPLLWAGVAMALSSALAALAGAWLIQVNGKFDTRLTHFRDLTQLGLGGMASAFASAVLGSIVLVLAGVISNEGYLSSTLNWWMGDVLGIVLMTPLLLVWWPRPDNPVTRPSAKGLAEAMLVLGATGLAGNLVFLHAWLDLAPAFHLWFGSVSQGYWMFFFITWTALRLGTRGTSLALLMVAMQGITGVYQGVDAFGGSVSAYALSNYWSYTLVLSLVGMALANNIAMSQQIKQSLRARSEETDQELSNVIEALNQHAIVATTDVAGLITSANDKLCDISGYTREEFLGKNFRLLNSGLHPKEFFGELFRTITSGRTWHGEVRNRAKNGSFYWVQTTVVPFVDSQGVPHKYVVIRTDITQRKAAEHELEQHRNHLEMLVHQKTADLRDSIQEKNRVLAELKQQKYVLDHHASVTITDVEGHITYANDKFCEFSGYTREEVTGKDHQLVNSGLHPKGFFKHMYEVIGRGEVWHSEVCNRAKNGELYWVDMTVAAFMDENGNPREYIGVRTNITQRKHAEEAAHVANRAKSEFLANMSHEIRTPMNGVVGMIDIMQETELAPEQRRMLDTIHKSSLSLLTILNDILDLSKIEAGKLTLETLPTPLREVAEEVTQLMGGNASPKTTDLSVFVSPDLPRWVFTDPTRLRQILLNLLGNAVKFSQAQEGRRARVRLHVGPCMLADATPGVQLSVIDNGIGISPQGQAKLFQPFTQADESTARKFGGTGLGLSITQRLVEMMGGRLSLQSTLGEGSTFTVELPLHEAPPSRMPVFDPRLDHTQVLAVTRDADLLQIVHAYCEAAGAQVSEAPDLADAREQVMQLLSQQTTTHVTVLVLGPDLTDTASALDLPAGLAVVRLVRGASMEASNDITVITHPLTHSDLLQGVALASGRLAAPELAAPTERRRAPRKVAPGAEEAQRTRKLILLAEDNETNRDVMHQQLELLGYTCEVAQDGAVALALWRTGRFALLLTDCHMPNMDGFELTAAIRQHEPAGTRLPIVAITANTMQGEAERCRERGMDDYLSKPLRMKELAPMLTKWLPQAKTPHAQVGIEVIAAQAELPVWNATTLAELVGDSPGIHRRLLGKFLINAREQVAGIELAAATNDLKAIVDIAHPLKSAARSVGALWLGELCQEIETSAHDGDGVTCYARVDGLALAFANAQTQIENHLAALTG